MNKRHHRIFSTYGDTPIKDIPTPINRIGGNYSEEPETPHYDYEEPIYMNNNNTVIELLQHIQVLLFVIIIIQIICLSKK